MRAVSKSMLMSWGALLAVTAVILHMVLTQGNDFSHESVELTGSEFPTPDVAAMDAAWDAGDLDALATLQADARAYYDAGGEGGQSIDLPKDTPDTSTIATQISSSEVVKRIEAMESLAQDNPYYGGSASADLVRSGLSDSNVEVRIRAAEASVAAAYGFAHAQPAGTPVWDWENDATTRDALISSVGDTNDEVAASVVLAIDILYPPSAEIRDALVARFNSNNEVILNEAILLALGHHEYSTTAVHDLLVGARTAVEPEIRSAAAVATAMCSVPNAEAILTSMMDVEQDDAVRSDIGLALGLLE